MKNRLEDFVNDYREDFDSEAPANDLWSKIEKGTEKKNAKILGLFSLKQMAAALLVLINAATIFYLVENRKTNAGTAVPTEQVTSHPYEQEIDQISKLVEIKQAKLKEVGKTNPVLYKRFTEAFGQLNIAYRELEKDLETNPNKEQLLEAMIQNLSLQQELLNQQLGIYQKLKKSRNEKNSNTL